MIHGAIAWLQEHRQRIDQALETLTVLLAAQPAAAAIREDYERLTRACGDKATPAAPGATPRANGAQVARKVTRTPSPHQPPPEGGRAHQVASILKHAKKPLSPREIRTTGDMTSSQVGYGLQVLSEQKLVKATGTTNSRRYELAQPFHVVWNGTKERNGDAPSLLGDRVSRGAS